MDHIIEAVRRYPCLWNTTAIEYRDQELKDAAWTEVMKETGLASVKEVKLKWKKLRDSYRDALKRQSDMQAREPGPGAKKNVPWKYMAQMKFLQPYMCARKKPAECTAPPELAAAPNGDAHSSDESESEEESPPKRRHRERLAVIDRKLDFLCRATTATARQPHDRDRDGSAPHDRRREAPLAPVPDPLDIFFNSMCQSTKRFPFPTQIKIKRILFEAVIEAEEALLAEQQSYASLWARVATSSSSEGDRDRDEKPPDDADGS